MVDVVLFHSILGLRVVEHEIAAALAGDGHRVKQIQDRNRLRLSRVAIKRLNPIDRNRPYGVTTCPSLVAPEAAVKRTTVPFNSRS